MHTSLKYSIHLACLPHHIALFKSFACIVLFSQRNKRNCYIHSKNRKKESTFSFQFFFGVKRRNLILLKWILPKKCIKWGQMNFNSLKTHLFLFLKKAVKKVFKNECLARAVHMKITFGEVQGKCIWKWSGVTFLNSL